jgi:5-methylthioadenosine/S-adenosylhomocysteine deaminase
MLLTARYILPVSAPTIEDGAIVVREGRIVAVGAARQLLRDWPDEERRDFGLAALAPGFVDTHTHLEYTALRGLVDDVPHARWKYEVMQRESLFDDADWRDSALLGGLEALSGGVTTVADIAGHGASTGAVAQLGLRGIVYREVEGMEKPLINDIMQAARDDIVAWEALVDDDLVRIGIAPHSAYACHPELFMAVAEYAGMSRAKGRPVALHLAGSREECQFVKYGSTILGFEVREAYDRAAPLWLPTGVTPVRYVLQWGILEAGRITAVHCTQVTDDDIEILRDFNVSVASCSRCNAKLGMGIVPLQKLLDAGVRVGLGTDSPAATNTIGMFEEMRTGLLMQRAINSHGRFFTAAEFLRLATLGAAEALDMDDEIGSLEVGKRADIIAVDLSHSFQVPTHDPQSAFVHTGARAQVRMTMVGGQVLYTEGQWPGQDAQRVAARNEELRMKLRG